jgi:hypothetical protein
MRITPASPYFGVNQVGLATSYGVAGRLGELRRRFWNSRDAATEARRLNRAYALGYQHGYDFARPTSDPSEQMSSGENTA